MSMNAATAIAGLGLVLAAADGAGSDRVALAGSAIALGDCTISEIRDGWVW